MRFYEKLDYLMQECGLSNVNLARKINIDASLVSKWRRGVKMPGKKVYVSRICEAIVPLLKGQYMLRSISRVSGIPTDELGDAEAAETAIADWLMVDMPEHALQSTISKPSMEGFHHEYLDMRYKFRGCMLRCIAEQARRAEHNLNMRIFTDEPYEWMNLLKEFLDQSARKWPELFSCFERVHLLFMDNTGSKGFRCGWDIMDHFIDCCEVVVGILDQRYLGAFQHSITIVGETGAVTSVGYYGSDNAFIRAHEKPQAIRELTKNYDILFDKSQVVMKEYPNYTAREAAQNFSKMLGNSSDIYYRSYALPPVFIPPALLERIVHRVDGGGIGAQNSCNVFRHDIHKFLKNNKLCSTFPVLRTDEVRLGLARFPHENEETQKVFMISDYIEALKYVLELYQEYNNLVIMPVVPSEIAYDCLVQEMSQLSVSKLKPRKYTYISTHNTVVAEAVTQVRESFAGAPTSPLGRKKLISDLQGTLYRLAKQS